MSATDLQTSIVTEVRHDGEFECCVNARIFTDTIKQVPAPAISLEGNILIVRSERGEYKMATEPASQYPKIETGCEDFKLVDSDHFKKSLEINSKFTTKDDLRPAMTGVFFNGGETVATDAHKLALVKGENIGKFIIPFKSVQILIGMIKEDLMVCAKSENITFRSGNVTIKTRQIDARYPDYNSVIPTDNPIKVQVDSDELLAAVRRVALYANKTTNHVTLNIGKGKVTISAQDLDFSNEATEELPCTANEEIKVGFNGKFLIDVLVNCKGNVVMELSTPTRPCIIIPEYGTKFLIMPVMI